MGRGPVRSFTDLIRVTQMCTNCRHAWIVGAGFLGTELHRICRATGMRVLTIDATAPADVQGAAQHPDTLRTASQMLPPDTIFCCTSSGGGDASAYIRCYEEVAQSLSRLPHAPNLVFCSTCSVYEVTDGTEVTEEKICPASSEKMRCILRAEKIIREAGGIVARLAALYGPHRCEIARRYIENGEKLPGTASRCVNYVHVSDAAQALLLLSVRGTTGHVYNVCAESFPLSVFYRQMHEIYTPPRTLPLPVRGNHGHLHQRVNTDKLRALGWIPKMCLFDFARHMSLNMPSPSAHAR